MHPYTVILIVVAFGVALTFALNALFPRKRREETVNIHDQLEFTAFLLGEQRSREFDFKGFIQKLQAEWKEDTIDDDMLEDTIGALLDPYRLSNGKRCSRSVVVFMTKNDMKEVIVDEYLKQTKEWHKV